VASLLGTVWYASQTAPIKKREKGKGKIVMRKNQKLKIIATLHDAKLMLRYLAEDRTKEINLATFLQTRKDIDEAIQLLNSETDS